MAVPVGPATVAGYSTSAVTLAGAVAAFLTGDRSEDTLVILVLAGYSAVSFVVTQVGRYSQAHAAAKKSSAVQIPSVWTTGATTSTGSSGSVSFTGNTVAPELSPDRVAHSNLKDD